MWIWPLYLHVNQKSDDDDDDDDDDDEHFALHVIINYTLRMTKLKHYHYVLIPLLYEIDRMTFVTTQIITYMRVIAMPL